MERSKQAIVRTKTQLGDSQEMKWTARPLHELQLVNSRVPEFNVLDVRAPR